MQKIKKLFIASLFIFGSCSAETLEKFIESFNTSSATTPAEKTAAIINLTNILQRHTNQCKRYKRPAGGCFICFDEETSEKCFNEEVELREGALLELIAKLQGNKRV